MGEFDLTFLKTFGKALAYTQPRILGVFIFVPIFNQQLIPGLLRFWVAAGLGMVIAPLLMPVIRAEHFTGDWMIVAFVIKEAFVGMVMGFLFALPFWAFEAVGFLIDNQRGASIAATLNPLTGNDSSPLGILFNQTFITYFFVSGGFLLMLKVLYDSFLIWDVFSWVPNFPAEGIPLVLGQFNHLAEVGLLLAAPAVIAMFLAEVGLALVSRFAPQLQVFFLAMPIKSALAIFVLLLYVPTLFDYTDEHIQAMKEVLPRMQKFFH